MEKATILKSTKHATTQDIIWNNFFIRYEVLASKGMSPEIELVIKDVVKIVKFIKGGALNNQTLCAHHAHLLFHSAVRWLSNGKVNNHMYKKKPQYYLLEK